MSQHKFQHKNLEVLYGYEWSFNGFFLVIYPKGYSEHVFSNLDLPNPAMTVSQIKNVLKEYDLPIPENLEEVLLNDRINGK